MTRTTGTVLDGPTILANARALAPLLRGEAAENERQRRLLPPTLDALRSAGVFRMCMPRSWGGPEVDLPTQVEVVEALSRADGATGWCAFFAAGSGYYSAHLPDSVAKTLFPHLDTVTAGTLAPTGRLTPVDGGYRLSGRWQFASGCTHADLIMATAMAEPPQTRIALLPVDQVEIIDTWHATGLAATASHDFAVDDVFVPAEHTFRWDDGYREGPLYTWPGLFAVGFVGVPLGIARAALDTAEEVLAGKMVAPGRPSRDEPRVRFAVARAEALVGAARSYAVAVVEDFWATLTAGAQPSRRQRAALAGSYHHTARTCREAVELVADAVGTASVFHSSPLERHRRDLTTLCHHLLAQPRFLELVGGLWLDDTADIDHPLF